jgi:hypothetical protein
MTNVSATFDESVTQFQDFLQNNGYSREVVWITPRDVILTRKRLIYVKFPVPRDNERFVRELFELGTTNRRGILFETICSAANIAFCRAWVPANDSERHRFLMPEGLKMSAHTCRVAAFTVQNGLHWLFLQLRYANHQALKRVLFNLDM